MSWRVDKDKAAVLIVDVQEKLLPTMTGGEAILGPIETLVRGAHLLKVPVYLSEQYPKGLGKTLPRITKGIKPAAVFEKTAFSAGEFADQIDEKVVILAGLETHICLRQTAYDLKAAGKSVVIAADATASRRTEHRDIALQELQTDQFLITSVEALLF
jgi:nicotinamidase-related amidase